MKEQSGKNASICPRAEIAAYVDCELAPREEIVLEQHLAVCETCRAELNEQKKLLCALDFALEENVAEIEIPKNFARVVATRAESNVSGLRNREERGRAVFLCASLFIIILVGLGAEAGKVFAASSVIFEKVVAIVNFAGHLTYDVAFGVIVILRSLCNQNAVNAVLFAAFLIGFSVLSAFAVPRILNHLHRT